MTVDHTFRSETPPAVIEVGWSAAMRTYRFRVFRRDEPPVVGGVVPEEIPTLRDLVLVLAPYSAIPSALLTVLYGEAAGANYNAANDDP